MSSQRVTSSVLPPATAERPSAPADPADLATIAEDLAAVSLRLDRAGQSAADGLVTMSLDVASQAVHLALVELQDCLVDA